jgi:diguanylate cyclase (GGDEF)-like protein
VLCALVFTAYAAAWIWDSSAGAGGPAVLFPLGIFSAAGIVLWAVSQRPGREPLGLAAPLAAGLAVWAGAIGFDIAAPRLALSSSTIISPLLMITANLCWFYALIRLFRRQPLRLNVIPLLDGVLVLSCALTVAGNGVLEPLWAAGEPALFLLGQAIAGLLLFAALVLLRYTLAEPLPGADALILTGVLLALGSESWQLWSTAALPDVSPPVLGVLRIAAGLLFLGGAYEILAAPAAPRTHHWERVAHWLPLLCLSVVSGLLVLHFSGHPLPNVVFGAAIGSLSLAVLRLGFALGENHRLRQEQSQLRSQNEEYIRLAISDPLTGLYNKGYFAYRLHEECARSDRYGQAMTLIALDLDNFKQVNDRYGHAAGDALLVAIGSVLRASSRTTDAPCRCGGDEFMLILPQTPIEQGEGVAERLRLAVNGLLHERGLGVLVSVSVGVAAYPDTAITTENLALCADQALYFAKHQGKNCCARWSGDGARRLVPGRPAARPGGANPPIYRLPSGQ